MTQYEAMQKFNKTGGQGDGGTWKKARPKAEGCVSEEQSTPLSDRRARR